MNIIWARTFVSLVLIASLCALLSALTGLEVGLAAAVVALIAHLLFSTFHIERLWRLLDTPVSGGAPSAPGVWGEIYYRLYKIAKRWHAQVRLVEQQHTRFIQAIQASPNGVAMLDGHDQIEWCNATSERHFGLDVKRDLRQHMTHLVRHPDFARYLNSHQYDEMLVMRGMGEHRQYVISVQVFPYGENRKLILSADITELERADAMRCDFVANVSHELKAPITMLSGFIETMRALPLSELVRTRYFELMEQQATRMCQIVDALLTLAKLEGRGQPPAHQAVNMEAVIGQLREESATLSKGQHCIAFEVDEALTVTGGEAEILSALGNLVANAVCDTLPGGSICIQWKEEQGRAVFAVTDNGLGIPAAELPQLTERFYRVSHSRDGGGTRLGLAIVKHVLQRHDAALEVKSEEGQGTTFTVRFSIQRTLRTACADKRAI